MTASLCVLASGFHFTSRLDTDSWRIIMRGMKIFWEVLYLKLVMLQELSCTQKFAFKKGCVLDRKKLSNCRFFVQLSFFRLFPSSICLFFLSVSFVSYFRSSLIYLGSHFISVSDIIVYCGFCIVIRVFSHIVS